MSISSKNKSSYIKDVVQFINQTVTLDSSKVDYLVISGGGSNNITLPVASTLKTGSKITFWSQGGTLTLNAQSGDQIFKFNGQNSTISIAGWDFITLIVLSGGQWLVEEPQSSIAVNQSWQNVVGSRALGVTYTNTTGKPIQLSVTCNSNNASGVVMQLQINGVTMARQGTAQVASADSRCNVTHIIPNGATYCVLSTSGSNGIVGLQLWYELR